MHFLLFQSVNETEMFLWGCGLHRKLSLVLNGRRGYFTVLGTGTHFLGFWCSLSRTWVRQIWVFWCPCKRSCPDCQAGSIPGISLQAFWLHTRRFNQGPGVLFQCWESNPKSCLFKEELSLNHIRGPEQVLILVDILTSELITANDSRHGHWASLSFLLSWFEQVCLCLGVLVPSGLVTQKLSYGFTSSCLRGRDEFWMLAALLVFPWLW